MIDRDDALKQGEVLMAAANASPVRPIARALKAQAQEWLGAAKWATEAEDEGNDPIIVTASLILPGCRIQWGGVGAVEVVRVANNGTGLMIAEPGMGARWENRLSPSSPVVLL